MAGPIDLNADMGESFGSWTMGNDLALLDVVTSANMACGFHAGDPDIMARTVEAAVARGVRLGAHPGFPDLQGFGRRRMTLTDDQLRHSIQYQLGAAQAIARAGGSDIRHLKLHGAMANMAAENRPMALTCYRAARAVAPEIVIIVMPGTAQQAAMAELGGPTACEIFADRTYNDDATLTDRSRPGAVIRDPGEASRRVANMLAAGAIITANGKHIPTRIDTICIHSDTPEALDIARTIARCPG